MIAIGLYLVGGAPDPVREREGDYLDWFAALADESQVRIVHADGRTGERLELGDVAGVVISGSRASLTAREAWMDGGFELLSRAHERGTPVLGVCFGHQLVAAHAGAEVRANPNGWEFATRSAWTTDEGAADALFEGVPHRFECNQAHQDEVDPATVPPSVRVLASSDRSVVQAIAVGEAVRGVQFHPEFNGAIARAYVRHKWDILAADADARRCPTDRPDALTGRDCPAAERVFKNFIDAFVRRA